MFLVVLHVSVLLLDCFVNEPVFCDGYGVVGFEVLLCMLFGCFLLFYIWPRIKIMNLKSLLGNRKMNKIFSPQGQNRAKPIYRKLI